MLTVAICDDEPYFVNSLQKSLEQYFSIREIKAGFSIFTNAESLLSAKQNFDLMLMDLKLPGMNGMEAVTSLREKQQTSQVIFITSYQEYAVQAFDVDAVHYLLKPVSNKDLFRALDKAIRRMEANDCTTITIAKSSETQVFLLRDILYCEAIDHKIYIHLTNMSYDYFGTLEKLQMQLDNRFFRCHKSYIVNLAHVVSRQGNTATVSGGGQVLISRRKQQEFTHELLRFVRKELL